MGQPFCAFDFKRRDDKNRKKKRGSRQENPKEGGSVARREIAHGRFPRR